MEAEDQNEHEQEEDIPKPKAERRVTRTFAKYMEDNQDSWDNTLIPEDLVQEIYQEINPEEQSSSEESYEFETESGTILRGRRKKGQRTSDDSSSDEDEEEEEDDDGLHGTKSLADVEGGIPKSQLKNMSVQEIESAIRDLKESINFVQTENTMLENTIEKMESREREIEASMPIFDYKYPWERQKEEAEKAASKRRCKNPKATSIDGERRVSESKHKRKKKKRQKKDQPPKELCDWNDSEDDTKKTSTPFKGVNPMDLLASSKVNFIKEMEPADREALMNYVENFGEIAPPNYDYMRHKYGRLLGPLLSSANTGDKGEERAKAGSFTAELGDRVVNFDEIEDLGDEDPDFPGFYPKGAKKLPIRLRLKYAKEQVKELENQIAAEKSKAIMRQNAVQVIIDTNVDAYNILNSLNNELTGVITRAQHPLTKRLMAEKIISFRKALKSKLLAEETKITLSLMGLKSMRKKVANQLKNQKDLGMKLNQVDFEQIRIRNHEYANTIEENHEQLKDLKYLTAGCFQVLKEERDKLSRKLESYTRMVNNTNLRQTLMASFKRDIEKYERVLHDIRDKNSFMRKRLQTTEAPNSLEYMKLKALTVELEKDVLSLQTKLRAALTRKAKKQTELSRISMGKSTQTTPRRSSFDSASDWLESIKAEVQKNNLMCLLTEHEMECASLLDMNKAELDKQRERQGRLSALRNGVEGTTENMEDLSGYSNVPKCVASTTSSFVSRDLRENQIRLEEDASKTNLCPTTNYKRTARGKLVVERSDIFRIDIPGHIIC